MNSEVSETSKNNSELEEMQQDENNSKAEPQPVDRELRE